MEPAAFLTQRGRRYSNTFFSGTHKPCSKSCTSNWWSVSHNLYFLLVRRPFWVRSVVSLLGAPTFWTFLAAAVVQLLSHVQLFAILWTTACQASLSLTISWSLLKVMSIELVMLSNHLIFCHPLLLLPSIFPSISLFSWVGSSNKWPKYWCFSFSISPSNEYSGLISFRMDWLDLVAVQRTLRSLLWHHSSKVSILQRSTFFIVQLTSIHDHWKNHSFDCTDLC